MKRLTSWLKICMTPRVPYTAMSRCCERSSTTPETTGRRWQRSVYTACSDLYVHTYVPTCVGVPCRLSTLHEWWTDTLINDVRKVNVRIYVMCFIHHGGTALELWYVQCYSATGVCVCMCACAWSSCTAVLSMGQCTITCMYLGVVWWTAPVSCDGCAPAEVWLRAVTEKAQWREGTKKVRWKWPPTVWHCYCTTHACVRTYTCLYIRSFCWSVYTCIDTLMLLFLLCFELILLLSRVLNWHIVHTVVTYVHMYVHTYIWRSTIIALTVFYVPYTILCCSNAVQGGCGRWPCTLSLCALYWVSRDVEGRPPRCSAGGGEDGAVKVSSPQPCQVFMCWAGVGILGNVHAYILLSKALMLYKMYTYIHTYVHTHMYICAYICTYMATELKVCVYVYIRKCVKYLHCHVSPSV